MNTLQEILAFTDEKSLRAVTNLSNAINVFFSREEKTSMRALIQALLNLPPISLEAAVEQSGGEAPFVTRLAVHSSKGLVKSTMISMFNPKGELLGKNENLFNDEITRLISAPDIGIYVIKLIRTGITGTGITSLEKNIPITVTPGSSHETSPPTPGPTPPHGPTPPPPPSCYVEEDPEQPGENFFGMRIYGGGFIGGESVEIIENGIVQSTTTTLANGTYETHISFLKGNHVVYAFGQLSKQTSNTAGFTV